MSVASRISARAERGLQWLAAALAVNHDRRSIDSRPVSANPGWYPDPGGGHRLYRYWDGRAWSSATSLNPSAPPPSQGFVGARTTPQDGPAYGQSGQPYGQATGQSTHGQAAFGQSYGSANPRPVHA